ncbi:BOS complex subunit TMEM147 [Condylostylus longicornis]|uniref:BOS complex subunit TMEM147 n=1 Tax=Condylostylus longicornis TaxID=2530218 RepID=UPI00244DBC2B|nr:BOS complex subunit TMEM147 [Condylostylus longicornis]
MTLYHFGNCIALVYVPYYMTYKYSGLSEYGAFWKCIQAGGIYIFTQLCKMLLLATFFDSENLSLNGSFNILAEFFRNTADIADLFGLAFILSRIPGKGHSKLITAGLGWATAEVILSRGIMLWSGARGAEFNWIYIQKCLESNISLMQHISTATLIWLFTRHDLHKKYVPVVSLLLIATVYKSLWLDGVLTVLSLPIWSTLAFKALVTIFMGFVTLHIYTGLAQLIGI